MRDVTVQKRLEISQTMEAVWMVMDRCKCRDDEENNEDENDAEGRDVVGNARTYVEEEEHMFAIGKTTSDVQTRIDSGRDVIVSGTVINTKTTETATVNTVETGTMTGIVNDHDQDFQLTLLDPYDHEYLRPSDVPLVQLSPPPGDESQEGSDMEIQVEYKDDHADFSATHRVHHVHEDEMKSKSTLQLCEKCKRQAQLAECLEAVVMDMNESVRAMNDYIIECALQIEVLERGKNMKRPNRKKSKRMGAGDGTGPSNGENKNMDDENDHKQNKGGSVDGGKQA